MTIKEVRKQTRLTQKQFAEKFNIPLNTLRNWEQGTRMPSKHTEDMINRILWLEETEKIQIGERKLNTMTEKIQDKEFSKEAAKDLLQSMFPGLKDMPAHEESEDDGWTLEDIEHVTGTEAFHEETGTDDILNWTAVKALLALDCTPEEYCERLNSEADMPGKAYKPIEHDGEIYIVLADK